MSTLLPKHRLAIDELIRAASDDLCSESSSSSAVSSSNTSSSSARSRVANSSSGHSSSMHSSSVQENVQLAGSLALSDPSATAVESKDLEIRGNRSVTFDPETALGPDRSERGNMDGSSSSYAEEMDDDEEDIEQTNSSGEMQDPQMKASRRGRRNDDAGVRRLRWAVLLMLLVSGVAVSIATYFSLRDQQTLSYTLDFEATVTSMTDEIIARSAIIEHDFEALGNRITVEEFTSQDSFPEVTLPYFEVSGADIRGSPFIELAAYAPLVRNRDEKDSWESYAAESRGWVKESLDVFQGNGSRSLNFTDFIYRRDSYGHQWHSSQEGPWLPMWQVSPPVGTKEHINFDLLSVESVATLFDTMRSMNKPVLSSVIDTKTLRLQTDGDGPTESENAPKGVLMHPVYSSIEKVSSKMVGVLIGVIRWDLYFVNVHPLDDKTVTVSLPDPQGTTYLYELRGSSAVRVLQSEERYSGYQSAVILLCSSTGVEANETLGPSITVYASESYIAANYTWVPAVIASAVAAGFALTIATFVLYDRYIQRKNEELRGDADRSKALVSSLFPANVHDRLFNNTAGIEEKPGPKRKKKVHGQEAANVFLEERKADENETSSPSTAQDDSAEADDDDFYFKSKPIADHFPNTTILFADIAGFTAWSASREPHDVFVLLETIYRAFDIIAKRRGVFKVETVGDCYVAVTGLPKPRKDHAVVMVKFARECLRKMNSLTKKLEVRLGPDVSDLSMRVGIHSGSVTGGVLRGEGSRFQLFGDSMNTASRIETSGEPNRIHISPSTAELIKEAGKGKWLKERATMVSLKGKGEMQTYWLKTGRSSMQDRSRSRNDDVEVDHDDDSDSESDDDDSYSYDDSLLDDDLIQTMVSEKTARLIEWNAEVLHRLLKQIVARRPKYDAAGKSNFWKTVGKSDSLLEEAWESICLPAYDPGMKVLKDGDIDAIQLDSDVVFQLKDFVTNLAIMHRDNPYHNFEHSSHVCMHVTKYLSRITTRVKEGADNPVLLKSLHDRTYRVVADPLTEFALVFASLILSIDHPGVPNSQVIKEKKEMARAFGGKSITQSNAFLLAWDLLLDPDYKELRQAICATKEEAKRFRQIVVNCVMATDVADSELQAAREQKWTSAFSKKRSSLGESSHHPDSITGQITSVVELLVQSADLSHTMQHYQVFCKWNERRFMESFKAYRAGRSDKNPAEHWFESQLRLYDDLVIPMATKIRDIGIVGPSSDEMLDFAAKNRYLWKENGVAAVKLMAEQADRSYPLKSTSEARALPTGKVATPAAVSWPVTAVPQPPKPASSSVAALPQTTLKIGENDVTTASVTSALSLLMQKVQIMTQQEEALMVTSSAAAPEAGASGSLADNDTSNDAKPSATAARTTATIQSALKIIDASSHGNEPL